MRNRTGMPGDGRWLATKANCLNRRDTGTCRLEVPTGRFGPSVRQIPSTLSLQGTLFPSLRGLGKHARGILSLAMVWYIPLFSGRMVLLVVTRSFGCVTRVQRYWVFQMKLWRWSYLLSFLLLFYPDLKKKKKKKYRSYWSSCPETGLQNFCR